MQNRLLEGCLMKKRFVWGLLLCGVLLAAWEIVFCDPARTPFQVEEQAKAGFAGLIGSIGVTVVDSRQERRHFVIRQGPVKEVAALPQGLPTATYRGVLERHPFLTPVEGYTSQGPFAYDPSGRLVVAALSPKKRGLTSNTALRVFDIAANETLVVFDDGNEWVVETMAWAPDSSAVAVIRTEYKRRQCIRDFTILAAHPASLQTFHLFVFSRDGRLLAQTTLVKHDMNSGFELVWLD